MTKPLPRFLTGAVLATMLTLPSPTHAETLKKETAKPMLAALDTETGGLNPQKNGLISIGAVTCKEKTFEGIILPNPTLHYEQNALAINGFTLKKNPPRWEKLNTKTGKPQEIQSKSEKTTLLELISFLNALPQHTPLAGCNIQFDINFLEAAAQRQGLQSALQKALDRPILDIRKLAKEAHQQGKITLPKRKNQKGPSLSLDTISKALGTQRNPHGFHDGLEDAALTLHCALNLLALLGYDQK
jgi:DNA polymerase III epsilon subunit-like protein